MSGACPYIWRGMRVQLFGSVWGGLGSTGSFVCVRPPGRLRIQNSTQMSILILQLTTYMPTIVYLTVKTGIITTIAGQP